MTSWKVRQATAKAPQPDDQPVIQDVSEPVFRSQLIKKLKRGWVSLSNLSTKFNATPVSLREAIDHLEVSGYNVVWNGPRVHISKQMKPGGKGYKDASPLINKWRKFGVIGDTHIGSTKERLDVLEQAYDHFAKEGITDVYHAGNMVDGESNLNRFELKVHGVTDQTLYLLDVYPQRSGITTHFITGECHEGWWGKASGLDWGRYMIGEARSFGREDFNYLGFLEADVEFKMPGGKSNYMRLFHPGGGSSYAYSYQIQKIIESFTGGEKPGMLLCGHFHKSNYFKCRNVACISVGCMQDQTTFMRKKRLAAHVGYWVVEIQQDINGAIRRIRPEETSFYDHDYHVKLIR